MIPHIISIQQKDIAEYYWGFSWTYMDVFMIQEALDWWFGNVR